MGLARLVGLVAIAAAAAACYTTEEVAPPPLRTSPASDRPSPSEAQNAELKDGRIASSSDPASVSPGGACTKSGLTKGPAQTKRIDVAGENRTFVISVPQGYGELPQSWRLVIAFHGSGGDGAGLRGWYDSAERYAETHAIVVYPDARNGNWDLDSPVESNPDIAFFDALVAEISSKACIDADRIFGVGFSNGAYFVNQLACRRGGVLRAIAPHAGGGPYGAGASYDGQGHLVCNGKPPAVKVFHAEDDYTVPISNADATLAHWTWANGCEDSMHGAAPDGCNGYDGCGNKVEMCRYWGVGHSIWSEGAKATWDFFDSF